MASTIAMIGAMYSDLGIYGVGEVLSSDDLQFALEKLRKMLDRWSLPGLTAYANSVLGLPLTPGQQYYLIGSSGSPAPRNILTGYGSAWILDSNGYRYELEVIEQDRWQSISLPSQQSDIPQFLFYDMNPFSAGSVSPYNASAGLYPVPDKAYQLFFTARMQLGQQVTQNPTVDILTYLPGGYETAMEYNLCFEVKSAFKSAKMDPDIVALALMTLADLKRANSRPIVSQYDEAVVPRGTPTYNYRTDTGG